MPLFVLTPPPMKASLLGELGFDAVVEYPFTREFAGLSRGGVRDRRSWSALLGVEPRRDRLRLPFRQEPAGRPGLPDGVGRAARLRRHAGRCLPRRGRASHLVEPHPRRCSREGEVAEAAGLLGYRYTVEARGDRAASSSAARWVSRPPTCGFARSDCRCKHGIYAVRFRRADGTLHDGVASFGRRPTVDEDGAPLLETLPLRFRRRSLRRDLPVSLLRLPARRGEIRWARRADSPDEARRGRGAGAARRRAAAVGARRQDRLRVLRDL